jgi:hypothetical protein
LSSKIARTLAALAVAGAPFIIATAPSASAANGCTVNNASTTGTTQVHVSAPPPSVTWHSTSTSCSYVSEGGTADFGCTLAGGRCEVYQNDVLIASCIVYANTSCGGTIPTTAGDVMRLEVYGGSGFVRDNVA